MASNLIGVRQGPTGTPSGRELLDTLETLGDTFTRLQRLFDAMTQQRDGSTDTEADFVTPARVFGFVDAQDILDPAIAQMGYNEINACLGVAGPALRQCAAKFKQ